MQLTLITYILFYVLIVIFVFFLIYWCFNYSVNEAECLSIALIAGLILVAVTYDNLRNKYYTENNTTNLQFLMIFTIFIVVITIVFLLSTVLGLLTFGKSNNLKIFKL